MGDLYLTDAEADAIDNLSPGLNCLRVGRKLQQALFGLTPVGKKWYIDPVNGNDGYDGTSYATAFKSLSVAYAALTANKNEILYIIGGASSIPLDTGFTWAKAYTHLVGITQPAPYSRCRIQSAAIIPTLFTISVNGCIFKNIHWQQGENGDVTSVNCVVLAATANQNYFGNCHFDSPLLAAAGTAAYRVLTLTGSGVTGARSNTFENCWFGDWTAQPTSTTGEMVYIGDATAGTQFIKCRFIINTTQLSMVPIAAASDIGGGNPPGYIYFEDCTFLALSTGVAVCFTAPTVGKIVLISPKSVGITAWAANSATILIGADGVANDLNGLGQAVTT